MNTTLTILLLAVLVSPAYVQHCERRQRIHLDSYQSTKVVFPQQFPVQKGYAGNLTCVWEILTESKFRIMVYPRTWTCGDMTVLNLFYGLSEMAEIDDCVICPSEKGFCPNIIQTRSSDAVLELITYSNDAKGGFDFRFMAINATALVDGCSSVGMIMQADRTPNYIASPNFPEAYPSEKNCLWLIKPVIQDNNTRLVFQFQSQSLEKGVMTKCTDYVTIEGLGEFCETDRDKIFQPSEKMYTENTETKVTFVSDFGFSESGFVLSFYIEDIAKPCLCQHGGTCKNETCLCSMGYKGEYCEKESIEIFIHERQQSDNT